MVNHKLVPTDDVAYSFAADVWHPVLHEGEGAPVSLKYTAGRFVIARPNGVLEDVTATPGVGLGGIICSLHAIAKDKLQLSAASL